MSNDYIAGQQLLTRSGEKVTYIKNAKVKETLLGTKTLDVLICTSPTRGLFQVVPSDIVALVEDEPTDKAG